MISIIEGLRDHRVLVIGGLMVDEHLRDDVHRVSPEAPVLVLERHATEYRLGVAANTGDTVVATLALALAAGLTLEDAMDLANLAADISVSRRGTSTVNPEEFAAIAAAGPV
ncbi:MAG: hypothetical protein IPL61_05415 [Myxococcales bacterium]|nr:hypothetical protein [Myxococcales bacterium]